MRTSDSERAIDMAQWAKNSRGRFDPDKLERKRCWGGLDLSSKIDITAFVKLFEPDDDGRHARGRALLDAGRHHQRARRP